MGSISVRVKTKVEDTKGVIRICKSKDRQHNGQKTDNTMAKRQTTQWSKEKGQKDKQPSTKHTHKTKDRVTRTPLKTGGELKIREVSLIYMSGVMTF